MKKKVILLSLSCLLVAATLLASCSTSSTTATTTTTAANTTNTTTLPPTTSTPPTTATTTTTTSASGNWWVSLGRPQYGGSMTIRYARDPTNFDPYNSEATSTIESGWMERPTADDWTLDPSVFPYNISYRPSQYVKGWVASDWEFTDPTTYVIHLHQGIYWQNIPPVNGREFVASDVVFHYDRQLGLGDGFTKPAPYFAGIANLQGLISVTAADNYTVVFKWKISNPELITETLQEVAGSEPDLEAPEAVQQWGNLNDWHHAIGTGPFILKDFVDGSSATLVKNPNYWGYDERYPQNKLPYINQLNILIIPDNATALAGLRTGKIDVIDQLSLQSAQSIQKTNLEMTEVTVPSANSLCYNSES